MHLAAFTDKYNHAALLRGHFISEQERRETWSKLKRNFSAEEALEIVKHPSSASGHSVAAFS